MYPIGISTCGSAPDEALFRGYALAGASASELSPSGEDYDSLDYAAVRFAADKAGVELWSFHLQFSPFELIDPSSPDAAKRAFTVGRLAEQIERAADIGITKFILHASAEPIPAPDRAERMKYAADSVAALSGIAARCGGTLCVEDLPRTCLGNCSSEIAALLAADDRARVCFDTNHLLTESASDFIAAVGEKIVTLHVSDYDFEDEKHWLPGEGGIDWAALYSALRGAGYEGVWMYELGFAPKRSMPRSRPLVPADLVRNAREIFAGSFPLTRVV